MEHEQWMLNCDDGEFWTACTLFNTKEGAITYGIKLLEKYNNNTHDEKTQNNLIDKMGIHSVDNAQVYTFCVGQLEKVKLPNETDTLLENIAESVYEIYEDYAEGYLDDVDEKHQNELQELIVDWAKRHNYMPNFFTIRTSETIDIRDFEEEEE